MSTTAKPKYFYGIQRGRIPGVYDTGEEECKLALAGSRHARHRKFTSREDALNYVAKGGARHAKSSQMTAGTKRPANISERCPGDQSIHHASLFALLRALETVPRGTRPLQIVSTSKYATDCINSWLARWLTNGFKAQNREPIKHEPLLRCISAHLDERRHIGQAVRFIYVRAVEDDPAARSAKALAKRAAQDAPVAPCDYDQLAAAMRARITGPPVPIARPFESYSPAPHTPNKRQRVEAAPPALAPAHAALAAALYSPRKMAILAQAAAILATPPILHPVFAAIPAVAASASAPRPPVWAAHPVVRSKVPLPGRPKTASYAPPPPPIQAASHALDTAFSPYASMLEEHGAKSKQP
ncbi:hypothetical protein B0H16DRAFT_1882873 [Mycena metata]|uniref:ribonuclease H n=1 Tax=Mycena metata TaxID=1033252 RepID=A0AAD7JPS6_9AGAR|nr:hypothetical protein B0H16DRAFT_1882873 [Mycena metata]